jgi:hypothetical protein
MKKIALFVMIILCSCTSKEKKIFNSHQLPNNLKEVSGITFSPKEHLIWTIEDSGNKNKLFALDQNNTIVKTVLINAAENNDWEDLTSDKNGNLYIGDFGNNDNVRKDLCILKINHSSLNKKKTIPDYVINFSYPEQVDFPPKKKELLYDCEAFIEFNNFFYLFTKNRSKDFDGTTLIYKIPNQAGNQKALLIGKYKTCNAFDTCAITGAAISPDDKKLVLLSHTKVWLFENFPQDHFTDGVLFELHLGTKTQKEAICFKNNDTFYVADEKTKKEGGNLYQYKVSDLKSKS